jgi:hypothetical protein
MVIVKETTSQDLTEDPLAYTTSHSGASRILQVLIKASEAITETVTMTFDSGDGASYDTVLSTTALSSVTDYVFRPDGECVLGATDKLSISCTDANATGTVYVTVFLEDLS